MDQESILAMEFLIYKGLDISKLVNTKATTRQAVNLKAKLIYTFNENIVFQNMQQAS